jgi:hypothetical protein
MPRVPSTRPESRSECRRGEHDSGMRRLHIVPLLPGSMPPQSRAVVLDQPILGRGPVRNVATRWRRARYQQLQIGVHSPKQRSKVGVLPKEGMKASSHRDLIITMGHRPRTHPIIELLVRAIVITGTSRPASPTAAAMPALPPPGANDRLGMGWSSSRDEAAPNDEQHEHRDQVASEQHRRLLAFRRQVAAPGIRHTARKLWLDDLAYGDAATSCGSAASTRAESRILKSTP